MKEFGFVIYRSWAYEIFKQVYEKSKNGESFTVEVLITTQKPEFPVEEIPEGVSFFQVDPKNNEEIQKILSENNIPTAFFFGWSWIIKDPLLKGTLCLGLHPSALPQYRGGSPIQHQVIAGLTESKLSLFTIEEGVDTGSVYAQFPLSLEGDITEIFENITQVGADMTMQYINDVINSKASFNIQEKLDEFPPLKRRKPSESEISLCSLDDIDFLSLHNFVRCLTEPYPNAFIVIGNKKIKIQKIIQCEALSPEDILLNDLNDLDSAADKDIYIRLKDGYAKIEKYFIE